MKLNRGRVTRLPVSLPGVTTPFSRCLDSGTGLSDRRFSGPNEPPQRHSAQRRCESHGEAPLVQSGLLGLNPQTCVSG